MVRSVTFFAAQEPREALRLDGVPRRNPCISVIWITPAGVSDPLPDVIVSRVGFDEGVSEDIQVSHSVVRG